MVDLRALTSNRLVLNEDGIWHCGSSADVSYPASGNDACFAVEDPSFWFGHRNACILETVRQFSPPGAIFDVGRGNGFVARRLQDEGLDVVLVEPGRGGPRNARRRGSARWSVRHWRPRDSPRAACAPSGYSMLLSTLRTTLSSWSASMVLSQSRVRSICKFVPEEPKQSRWRWHTKCQSDLITAQRDYEGFIGS